MKKLQFIEITPEDLKDLIMKEVRDVVNDLQQQFQPKEPDDFMTRMEVKEFLKISLTTVHQWVKDGIIKPYKMGNRTFFSRKEITKSIYSSNI
jgi:excisionase family DNA binding protein